LFSTASLGELCLKEFGSKQHLIMLVLCLAIIGVMVPVATFAKTATRSQQDFGLKSNRTQGTITFPASNSITHSPVSGSPSSTVKVSGSGFGISETVTITFDTTSVSNITTSSTGTFSKKITVPKSAQPGNHTITARGLTSGHSASATFLVRTNWTQFGYLPQGGRYNTFENTINVSNVSGLIQDWTDSTGGSFSSTVAGSPAVANGIVYVGSDKLYAFNASSGVQLWTVSIGTNIGSVSSPTIVSGVVYITTTFPGALYAFSAQTGTQLWSASLGNNIVSNPSVASGIAYIGVSGFEFGELEAFNASTGTQLWTALNGIASIEDAPAVINGTLYIGSADDHVYALNPQAGAQIWASPTSDWVISSPAVAKGIVYVSTYDGKLTAFNASIGT
jgi:outer membrane protein assembly factor BamB